MSPWNWCLPLAAYLYGAVPFGWLAGKLIKGVDIRQAGSGNIGATNAARVLGFKFFPPIFLLDVSKGLLPTLAADRLAAAGAYDPAALVLLTGLAAILGHAFPVYLGFRGGKAVATGTGVFLVLAPRAVVVAAVVWALVFALWRYVSVASMTAAVALAAAVVLTHPEPLGSGALLTGFTVLAALLVIALHRSNLRRLLKGTEAKIGGGRADGPDG